MRFLLYVILPVMLTLNAACGDRDAAPERGAENTEDVTDVIVDTDMGMDDARALLALTGSPGIRLAAVIVTGGSASAAKGADNAIGIIESSLSGYVPVIRGMTPVHLEPPPWRENAETMGGHPFPPPRTLSQQTLEDVLGSGGIPKGRWLILGPLSSSAAMERTAPGTLSEIEAWIPATVDGTVISGWNIACDPDAARVVLESAGMVFIVDAAAGFDAPRILSEVEGDTPAAIWIGATIGTDGGAHAFLFDEIAAAAVAAPDIFSISSERYRLSSVDGRSAALEQSDDGNIRIVRLKDAAALEHVLHGSWERNPDEFCGLGEHSHQHTASADPVARMKDFHGHLGPYVVLGYRMGMIALERTGSSGHFEISAEVHSILRPPRSCLIDGVQLGSGCTLGKRNITIEETGGPPFAIFTTSRGDKVTVRLRAGVPAMLQESIGSIGVEATGLAAWEMSADSLFEITTGD
jgi:inosine-uridine nucleoside N-ribohydrolase